MGSRIHNPAAWGVAAAIALALAMPAMSQPISRETGAIVTDVRWEDGALRVNAERPLQARLLTLDQPDRLVLDLYGAELADPALAQAHAIHEGPIRSLRAALHSEEGFVRFVLDCDTHAQAHLTTEQGGRTLVLAPGLARADRGAPSHEAASRLAFGPPVPEVFGPPTPAPEVFGPPLPKELRAARLYGPPIPTELLVMGPPRPTEPPSADDPEDEPETALPAGLRYGHAAWDGAPQPLQGLEVRRRKGVTTLHVASERALAYEVAQEWAPPRVVVRIPRARYSRPLPDVPGADRVAVTTEGDDWVLRVELPRGLYRAETRRDADGRGFEVSWTPVLSEGRKPLVIVDAGHGGVDPGAIGPHGVHESVITLGLAQALVKELEASGRVRVLMTRASDVAVDLGSRARLTLALHPALFVSLHGNSCETPETKGLETYYRGPSSLGAAKILHRAIAHDLERPDRGVRQARLYVLRNLDVPSVLVESGYLSNLDDERMMGTAQFQHDLARALTRGILEVVEGGPLAELRPGNGPL